MTPGQAPHGPWLRLRLVETRLVRALARHERRPVVRLVMLAATRAADGWAFAVVIPTAVLVGGRRGIAATACGIVAGLTIALLVAGIKHLVKRSRPTDIELIRPIGVRDVHAFPSGHSAHSFNLVVQLALVEPWLGLAYLPVALVAAASRVFFGLHFPTDVLAGSALGAAVAWGVSRALVFLDLVAWPGFG